MLPASTPNSQIFDSKRYRFFFDVPIGPEIITRYIADDHEENIDLINPELASFCETMTGQKAWNGHTDYRYARWAYLQINLFDNKIFILPYIASHLRFAFVRKRDAMLFKLRYC
jgi:hypothetical protein